MNKKFKQNLEKVLSITVGAANPLSPMYQVCYASQDVSSL
jgi:hypothetical protein